MTINSKPQSSLYQIRKKLARMEDSLILSLIGRSEFKTNKLMYTSYKFEIPEFYDKLMEYHPVSEKLKINKNKEIREMYLKQVPFFCESGEDNHYQETTLWDMRCLQDLSRRIHFGIFIAESKYKKNPKEYFDLIKNKDIQGIVGKLRNLQVEEGILKRVRGKGEKRGFNPEFVHRLYKNFIIPITIDVEKEYLLKRIQV